MDLILDATVAVESDTASDIESGNTIDVTNPITNNLEVTFDSNQFSIVGDDMVVVTRYDDAPQWLRDTIDNIVNVKTAVAVGDLNTVKEALDVMLEELEAAKNTYQLSIVSSDDIDSRILTAITTANSALQEADATILEIAQTAVTPSEAGAIAANAISASLSANGQIGSTLSNIQEAMTTLENTMASDISFLESVMEGEIEGNASAMETIRTYVGIDEAGASIGTGLSAYLEGSDGTIGGADSQLVNDIKINAEVVESKWAYNSTVNVNGVYRRSGFGLTTNYVSGSGTLADPYVSEFWIDASRMKFTNSNKTGGTAPFTIDATGSQPQVTFNGKVTFGSGQTGTIDEAIAAVVETVAVGDKNINITDNLIPITSLVADTDNSGYQFIGTPTKSNTAGIDTYAEAQIVLDSGDEVYSPYVDDVNVSYYYRFGIKGITNGSVFKIVTINGSNVATSNTITITMNSGQSITAGNWYIIEGMINPTGGSSAAVGSIRNSSGVKIGTVSSLVLPSGTAKLVLGWVANCIISRIKMCKVTADTVTSDLTMVNGQLSTLQSNIDNISWNSLQGKDLMAQQQGFANYTDMTNKYSALGKTIINGGYINTGLVNANSIVANSVSADRLVAGTSNSTVWTGGGLVSQNFNGNSYGNIGLPTQGFRLSSNAAGTSADPNIYGAYIKGATLDTAYISYNDTKVRSYANPNNTGKLAIFERETLSPFLNSTKYITKTFYGNNYQSGYNANRCCGPVTDVQIVAKLYASYGTFVISITIQYSLDNINWITLTTVSPGNNAMTTLIATANYTFSSSTIDVLYIRGVYYNNNTPSIGITSVPYLEINILNL